MTQTQTKDKEDDAITYMANVHTVVYCQVEECGFKAEDYITAVDEAEAHHRETGHDLLGERGSAIWIGTEGRKYLDERLRAFLGDDIADEMIAAREGRST